MSSNTTFSQNTRCNLKAKFLAYLQIVRLPNIFTAIADVLAGYLIVNGSNVAHATLLALVLTSSCIYAGGCVLNDICDREIDAKERPERPIPSGKISLKAARILLCLLFTVGIISAFFAGRTAGIIAILLVILVCSYDCLTKDVPVIGSINMGSCRALNLILGACTGSSLGLFFVFPIVTLVYVAAITSLSNFETGGNPKHKGQLIFAVMVCLILFFLAIIFMKHLLPGSLVFLGIFMMQVFPPLSRAISTAKPEMVGRAIKYMVLAIPILDAVYVAGTQGIRYALPVFLCLIPAYFIARFLYVT